jgi:membrane protein DedA with SNARE-associated domain
MLLEGEAGLTLAGVLSEEGHFHYPYVVMIAITGVMISDSTLYFLGRFNKERATKILGKYNEAVTKVEHWISKHAPWVIIFERFMYGLHIPTMLLFGISKYSYKKFLFFDFIGASLWALTFSSLGYFFGKEVIHLITLIQHNLIVIIIIALLFWMYKKRKKSKV